MSKFDSIDPDSTEYTLNTELGYERVSSGGKFNAPCAECQEPTQWGFILLECPCCSHECLDKLRTQYFDRLRESIDNQRAIDELIVTGMAQTALEEGETFPDGFKLSPDKGSTMVH